MTRKGFTIVELMLGMAVVGTLALVITQAFTIGLRSHQLTSSQTAVLSNARKSLNGEGAFAGMLADIQQAAGVISLSTSTLSVLATDGSTTTYTVNSAGSLRVTKGATTTTRARGLSGFQTAFYAQDSGLAPVVATTTASVRFATVSFTVTEGKRSVQFFSGAGVRNVE